MYDPNLYFFVESLKFEQLLCLAAMSGAASSGQPGAHLAATQVQAEMIFGALSCGMHDHGSHSNKNKDGKVWRALADSIEHLMLEQGADVLALVEIADDHREGVAKLLAVKGLTITGKRTRAVVTRGA